LEDGGGVLNNEDDGFILQEYRIESTVITANNEFFTQEASTIIDFSNQNPFSEVDRY
jgi:hypothetical protein